MRGLACLLMFQTHCYDAWLSPAARKSTFFMYSQLGGTFPAPLFLFLAGISFALVTDKLIQNATPPAQIARLTIRRGAEILAFGLLFRLQEFLISWGWAPWSDLFRVDILNIIGLSMMMMGTLCWIVLAFTDTVAAGGSQRMRIGIASAAAALTISLLTWQPRRLPWWIESYINGVHSLGTPQAWLFPIFPWSAFAFAGLALGFLLQSEWPRIREAVVFITTGLAGVILIEVARWLDARPFQLYSTYDFWHTSPNFFLIRVGFLWIFLCASYAWCRWGAAIVGFSPLIQLGQTSLLVYWIHIELVYGRFAILRRQSQSIGGATLGLLTIFLMMLALSWLRTHFKNRRPELWGRLRHPATS